MNIDAHFWPYFAGFFDGEGCLSVHRNQLLLTFGQAGDVGKQFMYEIRRLFKDELHLTGKLPVLETSPCVKNLIRKPRKIKKFYQLRVAKRNDVVFLLERMFPFLIIKKPAAQDFLRYVKLYPPTMALTKSSTGICRNGHRRTKENTGYGIKRNKMYKYCLACVKNATAARKAA